MPMVLRGNRPGRQPPCAWEQGRVNVRRLAWTRPVSDQETGDLSGATLAAFLLVDQVLVGEACDVSRILKFRNVKAGASDRGMLRVLTLEHDVRINSERPGYHVKVSRIAQHVVNGF